MSTISEKPAIETHGLGKSYRRGVDTFWALRDVSFQVEAGECVGVIGRNGAGKSTLLRCLGRITRPTTGNARLRGRVAALLEVGTGFHPDLSGRENVFLNGTLLGMKRREITAKLDAIVDFAGIEEFLDVPVKRYSSGMYIRLAFAVAAHLDADCLLVDEVLAVGDYAFQQKCLEKTRDVAGQGRTVLFVSHNLGAVHRLCGRSLLLEKGALVKIGTTASVVDEYLRQNVSAVAEYVAPVPKPSAVRLSRIALVDALGQPRGFVNYHDPIRFRVEYEVTTAVSGVAVGVGLGTFEYIPLFTTADYDTCPSRLGAREPGQYQALVEIPGGLLNTGKYIVQVYISSPNTRTIFDNVEAFTFDVVDSGTAASYHGINFRRGVIQPQLDWKVTYLGASQ